jgi:hypothetical protein
MNYIISIMFTFSIFNIGRIKSEKKKKSDRTKRTDR